MASSVNLSIFLDPVSQRQIVVRSTPSRSAKAERSRPVRFRSAIS